MRVVCSCHQAGYQAEMDQYFRPKGIPGTQDYEDRSAPAVCHSYKEQRAGGEAVALANDARAPLLPPPGTASGKAAPPYDLQQRATFDASAISGI